MGDLEIMKTRFNTQVNMLKSKKGKNHQLFTRNKYNLFLMKVKTTKEKTSNKTSEEYQRLSRYDIVKIGNIEKLVVPVKNERDPIIYYTFLEEIFDIIHETHISIGHGGQNRMMKELRIKYKNITVELVMSYLNLCESCQKKMNILKKGLVVKPIKSSEFNSRCQIDLNDMQMVTSRCDNGREFTNKIIEEVCGMWNELKIVHGKPRHSQSQGSVECANQDIEKIPYEAMFGCKAKIGLKTSLPANVLSEITSEEDLKAILEDQSDAASQNAECDQTMNSQNDDNVKTQHDSNMNVDNLNENLQLLTHNVTIEALNIDNNNNNNSQAANNH
ncbi:KRAB-A domain-containing protein 2-like [Pseudomyrmex gracilis]|uniref:KRAB-A domain-containing protein 2-like n=1 Tax=Pseudomyrmex gracilis TaxID=219809 RepID=UPI0009953469|nr:KRAB-A domain-containing protein 2-like [Pseudomyrmex gracilis]